MCSFFLEIKLFFINLPLAKLPSYNEREHAPNHVPHAWYTLHIFNPKRLKITHICLI